MAYPNTNTGIDKRILIVDKEGLPIDLTNPLATTATISGDVNIDAQSVNTDGLIGKSNGGDFVTAYTSATQITCSGLPTYHANLISEDIETIRQINNLGKVVHSYSRDDIIIDITLNVITIASATFAETDKFVIFTNIPRAVLVGETGSGNVTSDTQRITIATDDINQSAIKTAVEAIQTNTNDVATETTLATLALETGGNLDSIASFTSSIVTATQAIQTAVELLDNVVATINTTTVNRVAIFDDANQQITSFGSPSTIATHRSPEDFTAIYTSNVTITLSGHPTITSSAQLVYIRLVPESGDSAVYVNGSGGVTLTYSSNIITIAGAGTPFASEDVYEVGINLQDKSYDLNLDNTKTIVQNPTPSYYQDVVPLISTIQILTTSFADLGFEIPCAGYNKFALWLTIDINQATEIEIRILHKHTSAGTEEYREIYLGASSGNITTINLNDYQVGTNADQLFKLALDLNGTSPYIQVQARMKTDGGTDAEIDACYYTLAYA